MLSRIHRYSILIKILIVYIIFHWLLSSWNNYLLDNIDMFYTPFPNQRRLIYYPKSPHLSLSAHWINKYYGKPGFKIIVIGDSKVEDIYVRYENSICGQLETMMFGSSLTPHVFNFGTSGMRAIYAYERIKKAVSYKPDLIVLALGAGNFMDVNWVFPPFGNYYDISLGKNLIGAYGNLLKINDHNAALISENLRGNIAPTYMFRPFYQEYMNGLQATKENKEILNPGEALVGINIGDVEPEIFQHKKPFYEEKKHFEVVRKIAELTSNAGVKLMIYIPPVNQKVNDELYAPGYYDRLIESISKQLEGYDVPILDLTRAVPDELFVDGGHVKEDGDRIIAEKLCEFIKKKYDVYR